MRKLGLAAAILCLQMAPMAAQASDAVAANPKLPMVSSAEPLLPKNAAPEARMSYACILGRAGGTALSMMLGSGSAWDALSGAISGLPPSAEQRAFCALGEVLAPHITAVAENMSQEAWTATQEIITTGNAQIGQAWAGLRDAARDSGSDLRQLCEASASCVSLRDNLAQTWSRLLPMR